MIPAINATGPHMYAVSPGSIGSGTCATAQGMSQTSLQGPESSA